jgi:hypothetical protein
MNIVYFLIGAVSLLISLLFFSLIALIWGLRQLLTISNQNDAIISFLQQISISIWHEPHIQARLQEANGYPALNLEG